MTVHGLLLAAGAGRRYGGPKALVDDWLARSVGVLRDGGCAAVTVVLGASSEQARALVPEGTAVVVAADWADGMGASLRAGLAALDADVTAVLVHLVDLPDVDSRVVARMLAGEVTASALRRASYDTVPGHPVLIGRDHVEGVRRSATGDRGARAYLATHEHDVVECGDLATGADVDTAPGS
ncbi:MAG TPA: nucleotidyltransferase family protein [Marmoricola sp.]|jgi:nicotine blue oxidoreductase|nr:nucleotidyltransferase family protein [Marmoricola sp.]